MRRGFIKHSKPEGLATVPLLSLTVCTYISVYWSACLLCYQWRWNLHAQFSRVFFFFFFFRGEKDFSILDALHFFHTLEVFLELFGAEVVLVYESTLVDVCFLLTQHVQSSSSCVAVIDACQSAACHRRHVCSDSVPFQPAHFQRPLNFLFIPSFLSSLTVSLFLLFSHHLSHI